MSRISAAIMALLLVIYLVLVAQLAVRFLVVDEPISKAMGIALFVLPLVGFWALVVEWVFGVRSERLGRQLTADGLAPMTELPHLPSGRIERAAADEVFPQFQAEVEAAPHSWQAWYRLGLAYDACGDRRRARGAIRRAIALSCTHSVT
ncbi:MAG: hypothetical protein ABIW32_09140 [Terrimesophilobacter sp.]